VPPYGPMRTFSLVTKINSVFCIQTRNKAVQAASLQVNQIHSRILPTSSNQNHKIKDLSVKENPKITTTKKQQKFNRNYELNGSRRRLMNTHASVSINNDEDTLFSRRVRILKSANCSIEMSSTVKLSNVFDPDSGQYWSHLRWTYTDRQTE